MTCMTEQAGTNADHISRRNFLMVSGAVPAAMVAGSIGRGALAADAIPSAPAPAKKYPMGLELYSVRTELARDLPNTLQTVAKIGYEVVEFYAPYYEWTLPFAKTVRSRMDDWDFAVTRRTITSNRSCPETRWPRRSS